MQFTALLLVAQKNLRAISRAGRSLLARLWRSKRVIALWRKQENQGTVGISTVHASNSAGNSSPEAAVTARASAQDKAVPLVELRLEPVPS